MLSRPFNKYVKFTLFFLFFIYSFSHAEPLYNFPSFNIPIKSVQGEEIKWVVGKNGAIIFFVSEHCPYDKDARAAIINAANWAHKNEFLTIVANPFDNHKFKKNNNKNLKKMVKDLGGKIPLIHDKGLVVANKFRVKRTPAVLIFGSNKKRLYYGSVISSPSTSDLENAKYLIQLLKPITQGKLELATSFQSPLGCKIAEEAP